MAFNDEATERRFRPNVEPVKLLNPMAEDESVLRTSLVPCALRTIQWNANRSIRDVLLYELGKVCRSGGENRALIIAATGALRAKSVHESGREFGFYDLKGDVEGLIDLFNLQPHPADDPLPAYYHPGRAVRIGDLVVFGELHPDFANDYKLKHRVYIAEIDVDALLKSAVRRPLQAITKFPSIRRDLSLLLNIGTRFADVENTIQSLSIPELVRIEPFDRLGSGPFAESKYALAISLTYLSPDRTLTDEEVENFDRQILESLRIRLGAELRQ